MADGPVGAQAGSVPATPSPEQPTVVDLSAHRARRDRAVTSVASSPVRHLPPELLEALMGAWGTAEELGLRPARRHLQAVVG